MSSDFLSLSFTGVLCCSDVYMAFFVSKLNQMVAFLRAPIDHGRESDFNISDSDAEGENTVTPEPLSTHNAAPTTLLRSHDPDPKNDKIVRQLSCAYSGASPIAFINGIRYVSCDSIEVALPQSFADAYHKGKADVKSVTAEATCMEGATDASTEDSDYDDETGVGYRHTSRDRRETQKMIAELDDNNSDFERMEKDNDGWTKVTF